MSYFLLIAANLLVPVNILREAHSVCQGDPTLMEDHGTFL